MSGEPPGFGLELLPAADESPRCAVHSAELEVDPGGTAFWADEVLVVDVPRPWPKPVWVADDLTAVPDWVAAAGRSGRRVRVLAAVPRHRDERRVVVYRRVPGRGEMHRTEHRCAPKSLIEVVAVLLVEGLDASPATVVDGEPPVRELMICTQGSHDVCCGSRGTDFALEVAAARPDVEVRMVSHTGGHRFAPTGITFPDGRMWGQIRLEEMFSILDREGRPSDVVSRCRGWTGVEGPGQIAERAVFAEVDGWWFDEVERTVAVEVDATGWRCLVGTHSQIWEVHVELGRAVPEIRCGQPGGGAAKPGVEYVVTEPPRVAL